tara:strand:+ start:3489 stop:3809 length:321 start_codon:yes stop_codon:yes gene_type:complete
MSLPEISALCGTCKHQFSTEPKRSFLGFQKVTCPSCNKEITYPLTSGYRATYWVLLVLMIVGIIKAFSEGGIAGPGGFGIAIIVALVIDAKIKSKVGMLESELDRS